MDDTKKMLRAIINGQTAFRQEFSGKLDKIEKKIDTVEEKLSNKIDSVDIKLSNKIDSVEKNLTKRIDKLGKQLAYLEDDAPTREEHEELKTRVTVVEHKIALAI